MRDESSTLKRKPGDGSNDVIWAGTLLLEIVYSLVIQYTWVGIQIPVWFHADIKRKSIKVMEPMEGMKGKLILGCWCTRSPDCRPPGNALLVRPGPLGTTSRNFYEVTGTPLGEHAKRERRFGSFERWESQISPRSWGNVNITVIITCSTVVNEMRSKFWYMHLIQVLEYTLNRAFAALQQYFAVCNQYITIFLPRLLTAKFRPAICWGVLYEVNELVGFLDSFHRRQW